MAEFTDKEILAMSKHEDADFAPDISDKQALGMVNAARRAAAWKRKREVLIDQLRKAEGNPEKRWQLAYNWLMKSNPDARYAVNEVIKECQQLRETRGNKFARADKINLRFGMRLPQVVLDTLMLVDPRIEQMERLSPEDAKRIYRKLEQAFPQFCIPREN